MRDQDRGAMNDERARDATGFPRLCVRLSRGRHTPAQKNRSLKANSVPQQFPDYHVSETESSGGAQTNKTQFYLSKNSQSSEQTCAEASNWNFVNIPSLSTALLLSPKRVRSESDSGSGVHAARTAMSGHTKANVGLGTEVLHWNESLSVTE